MASTASRCKAGPDCEHRASVVLPLLLALLPSILHRPTIAFRINCNPSQLSIVVPPLSNSRLLLGISYRLGEDDSHVTLSLVTLTHRLHIQEPSIVTLGVPGLHSSSSKILHISGFECIRLGKPPLN